jgi:hypothetical protein
LYSKVEWNSQRLLAPLQEAMAAASVQQPLSVLQQVLPLLWALLPALPPARSREGRRESIL